MPESFVNPDRFALSFSKAIIQRMANLVLTGALLILEEGPRQLALHVTGDQISAIGGSPRPGERAVELTGVAIFPGMINCHDQLHLNHYPPYKSRMCYPNARDWYRDVGRQLGTPPYSTLASLPIHARYFVGGLKNLLSGATTVLHHGNLTHSLRSRKFPVRVVRNFGWAHSLMASQDLRDSYARTVPDIPWIIRIAEGTDSISEGELSALTAYNCLGENTILVHGVGLSQADLERIVSAGAGLIWCPACNEYLLGQTQYHPVLLGRMALGTGPRLAGSVDLLEELKLAAEISSLPPARLLRLVTGDAAHILRLPSAGRLAHGAPADLIGLALRSKDPYQTLLESRRADLSLVICRGRPVIANPDMQELFTASRTAREPVLLDGVPKLMARAILRQLERYGVSVPGLESI
jgi:cytosine/adenosine deaminase-related metal-dependent hydrolase